MRDLDKMLAEPRQDPRTVLAEIRADTNRCEALFQSLRPGTTRASISAENYRLMHHCADVNTTRTRTGTHEQWVWKDHANYVYFDGDVVTATQE